MLTFKHLKRRFINLSEEVSRAFPLCSVCCKVTNNFFSIRRLPTRPQQDFSQFSCSCWCSPLLSCSLLVPVGLLLHYPSTSLVVFLCFLFPPLAHIARLSVVCFPPSCYMPVPRQPSFHDFVLTLSVINMRNISPSLWCSVSTQSGSKFNIDEMSGGKLGDRQIYRRFTQSSFRLRFNKRSLLLRINCATISKLTAKNVSQCQS